MAEARKRQIDSPLNALDADIITLLQSDGRCPNTEIARQLKVAEGTVRNRIARLLKEDVIKFGVWPNPLKIGYQTYAFIEIQVNPPDLEEVAERLASFPEIAFVGICTGSFDIHVAALFYSNDHMYELITKRLNHVKGVLRTSTSTVMRIVKREFGYPVPGASVAASKRSGNRSGLTRPAGGAAPRRLARLGARNGRGLGPAPRGARQDAPGSSAPDRS
jgi:Lrp/AsnC family transcriptional regulator, regulator for asnA, asnC and gidA